MDVSFDFDAPGSSFLHGLPNCHQARLAVVLFAGLLIIEAVGLLVLGTGRSGLGVVSCCVVLSSFVAIACAWAAFHRAEGVMALFWFLFIAVQLILLVPTLFQTYDTLFAQTTLADSTWRLLYCLYGAPILMMLFLPETNGRGRLKWEIFLDLFQLGIVVTLVYATFFFAPVQSMLPADAFERNLDISNLQSVFLLLAAFLRLQFARAAATRDLLLRLSLFLLVCAVATLIGNWIDLHHYLAASAWFNLGWTIPQVAAGIIAVTWVFSPDIRSEPEPVSFFSLLAGNLLFIAMLCCINVLMDRWEQTSGAMVADIAIAVSLIAFALRLALTEYHQQQEIAHRRAAQKQLTVSHERIGSLLESSRRQTSDITRITELGSLLQACATRDEIFRLIPERLRRLFPGASGCITLLGASGQRVESVAEWGIHCPADQIFAPEQCWALRRGCVHTQEGGVSIERCAHLRGEGPSVCVPLVAGGESIGTLVIQNDDAPSPFADPYADIESEAFVRRRQLAATVAESIALAVANMNLRESLRLQAVRDPLTGLYNRRYMQEFLNRELHSARRKHRPLAVLMLDLDHFKPYNDTLGHAAGDQVLAAVGETLLRSVRAEDVACRYGGDEFVLILPECSLAQATARGEEIRNHFQEYLAKRDGGGEIPLAVSIGVAAFDETTDRVDLLFKYADDALYQSKRGGGNRVVAAPAGVGGQRSVSYQI